MLRWSFQQRLHLASAMLVTLLFGASSLSAAFPDEEAKGVGPTSYQPAATQAATTQPAASQPVPTLTSAHELWVVGEYEQSAAQFRALAAEEQNTFEAVMGLVRCDLSVGRYEDALDRLSKIKSTGLESSRWQLMRAECLTRVGQHGQALESLAKAVELDLNNFQARTKLGQLLEVVGRRDEAIAAYAFFDRLLARRMPTDAEDITAAAVGFYRYSVLTEHGSLKGRTAHVLNEMLQVAYERVDRNCSPARIAAADLLRQKFNVEEATQDYRGALRINRNLAEAHVGLGLLAIQGWQFEQVEKQVDLALAINPRLTAAHTLLARSKILERKYDRAIEACQDALDINPNDIDALAVMAAAHRCNYDMAQVTKYEQRALTINPRCAVIYAVMGNALATLRQYAESAQAFQQAIENEPTDANARAELGLMYMQWGDEQKARQALEAAWNLDEYNERTFNSLDLLEKMSEFAQIETEHFIIRFNPEVDWAAAKQVASFADELYEDVCIDYDTELSQKTTLEIFATHRDFGVRITGKPWLDTVGVCTGWVIALDSPRSSPQTRGPFNIAGVLRHEFIHTVTLALTENRIAHWFTEGLATYGEDSPRSFSWCELLAGAIRRDRLFTLDTVDWGFSRPKLPTDRALAYAQSEWMIEYIVQKYGFDVLPEMLEAFRVKKTQPEVFLEVLKIETSDFDRDFGAWARSEARRWPIDLTPVEEPKKLAHALAADPTSASLMGRFARAHFDHGDIERAVAAARTALTTDDGQVDALRVLVKGLGAILADTHAKPERQTILDELIPACRKLADVDRDSWIVPQLLGEIALRQNRFEDALVWLERFRRANPMHPDSYRGLSGVYLQRGEREKALPLLAELVRLDDRAAEVPASLADIHAASGRLGEARFWYTESLNIDPYRISTYEKRAGILMRMDETAAAAEQYEILCRLEPTEAAHFARAAFAYKKLGDIENTQRCAAEAVKLDPASGARSLLQPNGG